jgi:glycosyltransferase involved in cell wall biosynthesis
VRIGIVHNSWLGTDASLGHVAYTTAAALAHGHDLQPYPPEYQFAGPARQRELLKEWLAGCDVIVGSVESRLFHVREELDRKPPYACLLLGTLSRGGAWLVTAHEQLRTSDVLIGNCRADVALAHKFFENATARCIPFAYDDRFYYPADPAEQSAVRANLGVGPDEPIVVYAGRITLEKNLHTLLKTFRVVLNAVPKARLVIAGDVRALAFAELGTRAMALGRTLQRLIAYWQLEGRVLFVGHRDADTLRALYSTASVLVNLSLNHDENFGLVQIEAMACGLPAVGTTWGGLKDTIREGVTGALAPTAFTPAGVKVDWWHAAERIVERLIATGNDGKFRERCAAQVRADYSMTQYARAFDEIVRECAELASRPSEPLRPSAFAECLWDARFGRNGPAPDDSKAPYRRGPETWELYRELIEPFAGMPFDDAACDRAGWCLPAPLVMRRHGTIAVNDPLYPLDVPVPSSLMPLVRRLIDLFANQAVIDDGALAAERPALDEALAWMRNAGLLLRTPIGVLDPAFARGGLGQPVFVMHEVDHEADIVCTV